GRLHSDSPSLDRRHRVGHHAAAGKVEDESVPTRGQPNGRYPRTPAARDSERFGGGRFGASSGRLLTWRRVASNFSRSSRCTHSALTIFGGPPPQELAQGMT